MRIILKLRKQLKLQIIIYSFYFGNLLLEHLKKTDCKLDTSENKLEALAQHTINISKTIKKEELNITVNKTYPDVNIENDIYGYCDIKFEKDKVDINFIKN